MIKRLFNRVWNSPTINTWISFIVVPLNTVIFYPLLLKIFDVKQIALWFLFSLYISMQVLADFGFYNTFVRVISYAFGGRKYLDKEITDKNKLEPNWDLVKRINQTMNLVYFYATIALLIFFLLMSLTVKKQINSMESGHIYYWISWSIIILFSLIYFNGKRYSNFLLGLNKVALVRRIQGFFSLLILFSNLLVLLFTKSFLLLILSSQVWYALHFLFIRRQAQKIEGGIYKDMRGLVMHKDIFSYVWPPAWKGGISTFASTGTTKLSGIIYAQLTTSEKLAKYLLALKILEIIKNISMAPFYSKIPLLSKLYGQSNFLKWQEVSKRGIFLSNITLISGVLFFGYFGDLLLNLISSNLVFPPLSLWYLLGFARFFHRYGAMHTQLYMTSNRVNSHISDVVAGILFISISFFLFPYFEVYAFGIGMLVGYFGFYIWYALYYSYKIIKINYFDFEFKITVLPFIFFVILSIINFYAKI